MMRMGNLHSRNIGILTIHQNHGPQVWHNELRISCFHLDPPAGFFGQVVFSTEFPPFLHFNCWKCHTRADESRSVVYANGGRFFCFLFFSPVRTTMVMLIRSPTSHLDYCGTGSVMRDFSLRCVGPVYRTLSVGNACSKEAKPTKTGPFR